MAPPGSTTTMLATPSKAKGSSSSAAVGTIKAEGTSVPFGKTQNGASFRVPVTKDMLDTLFTNRRHNSLSKLTLGVMCLTIILYSAYSIPRELFLAWFAFWRLSYDLGLGMLLKLQSDTQWFTRKLAPYLDKTLAQKGGESNLKIRKWLKKEISINMESDYDFEASPVEFNSWLVFRGLVDLVLLNDFTSYMIFALVYTELPSTLGLKEVAGYGLGVLLFYINIWVKRDAHRVVKDFAWYWGDFFFLMDGDLTFDGVFEIAPHPMYSIGYVGYYGISLMTRSWTVFYASLLAHLAQFLFLVIVENPRMLT